MIVVTSSEHLYMGNKMLQYALFIVFAEENKIKIANPSFAPYAHHFKTTSNDLFCRYPAEPSLLKGGKQLRLMCYKFFYHFARRMAARGRGNRLLDFIDIDWDKTCNISEDAFIKRAKRTKYMFVMGWQFKHNYNIALYRPQIRSYFEPLDHYRKNIDALKLLARRGIDLLVGIHIRQGDYKTFEGGKYFYESEGYAKAMHQVLGLFPETKVRFLVCSNVSQDQNIFKGLDVHYGTGQVIEDMYAFADCDYIVGPPSTYTMWASFYGEVPLYMMYDTNRPVTKDDFKVVNSF